MEARSIILWVLALIPAVILGQSLFFKFTAAQESVYIFTQLGVEPWGRILLACAELIVVIMLLIPRTAAFGGAFAIVLMLGALGAHITRLGYAVQNDGGLLFLLALVTMLCALALVILRRSELLALFRA